MITWQQLVFQWKIHHFPPFVKTSAKIIKFCKPSLISWFNIKDHHSRILFILSFLLCNSIACNWLSCDLQSMAAYRWLCCLLYYKRNLQPSDWLIGKVLISYWPEVTINLLILKNSFSHTRTFTLKTCKNNYTILFQSSNELLRFRCSYQLLLYLRELRI